MTSNRLRLAASLAFGLGLLFLPLKYADLPGTMAAIGGANLSKLVAALSLLVLAYLLGGRWMISQEAAPPMNESDADSVILRKTREQLAQLSQDLGVQLKEKRRIELSIVIPAYNESIRLPNTMLETVKWCEEHCSDYEIIIVDDGSTDRTLEIGRLFAEYQDKVRCIANPHQGKGAAVRSGMLNSSGEQVLFMDADGATPLEEIAKLRGKLQEGYAVAIGSRIVQTPGETLVVSSLQRKIIGRLFAAIVDLFGVRGIGDTQCGFKIFRKEVIRDIFTRQKLEGFAFDVEILFLAHKLSLRVCEVPINWHNKEGSKVNLILDSMRMLRDVLRLKLIHKNLKPELLNGELSVETGGKRL